MNVEIMKELVRTWRAKTEPSPQEYLEEVTDEASAPQNLAEKKIDEAVKATLKHCAQDLEDVIRIYHEFKHWAK